MWYIVIVLISTGWHVLLPYSGSENNTADGPGFEDQVRCEGIAKLIASKRPDEIKTAYCVKKDAPQ